MCRVPYESQSSSGDQISMIYAYLLCVFLIIIGIMSSGAFRKISRSTVHSPIYRRMGTITSTNPAALSATVAVKSARCWGTTRLPLSNPSYTYVGTRAVKLATALCMLSSISTASAAPAVAPVEYFRKDYKPLPYSTDEIHMDFKLGLVESTLTTRNMVRRNLKDLETMEDLTFDGEDTLDLQNVRVDDRQLTEDEYSILPDGSLRISADTLPKNADFVIETTVRLQPEKNLALSGLYASNDMLCTQCEAMGFRRITYSFDRPDVLSKYKVRLEGDETIFPILLSNGNKIDSGKLSNGRHYAVWEDPFPKPSYLFALVAGKLGYIEDTYRTKSGRKVSLGIFSEPTNANKLEHAMYSLKESMKWDEDTFNLECDLDVYNIVATNDFNMGAMENKGLNIFNSAYVLADPKTATDIDYERILAVIAHEYFHNWTGNRVTVRDWFQLTLKEGLTVFRDQWFSSDATSAAVKRIEDVRSLRGGQFKEDASPMSHPIRPESYISMDNFYTATVYSKGAEVVGMYRTILGEEGFKKGLQLYFDRHDGTAVTCDDFRNAMVDANGSNGDTERWYSKFENWYSQSGTPVVTVTQTYDESKQEVTLKMKQETPDTPGQKGSEKGPFVIPIVVGLLDRSTGSEVLPSQTLIMTENEQSFTFSNIRSNPIASVLRGFSAPVKLKQELSDEDLAFLIAYDTDSFNKWDAGAKLSSRLILKLADLPVDELGEFELPKTFVDAFRQILETCKNGSGDASLTAYALQLPDATTLSLEMPVINVDQLLAARKHVKKELAKLLQDDFAAVYDSLNTKDEKYEFSPAATGKRRLKNTCLDYLMTLNTPDATARATTQFENANCMTDSLAALSCLTTLNADSEERKKALAEFYEKSNGDALVLNKWFGIQAMADIPDALKTVKELKKHKDFIISNPNRARSLISSFAANMGHFHKSDGSGYEFIADCVLELDALNPQVASRLVGTFSSWRRYDEGRQALMKSQLEKISQKEGLSKDTFEVVSRSLK